MFCKQFEKKAVDACIVVLMSHGKCNTITTTDEKDVNIWKQVIDKFHHVNCGALKGIPKIFIIQACQDIFPEHKDGPKEDDGYKDMLVCMSTCPGNVAYRNPKTGSKYISKLLEVFEKNPSLEIREMLEKVSSLTNLLRSYF